MGKELQKSMLRLDLTHQEDLVKKLQEQFKNQKNQSVLFKTCHVINGQRLTFALVKRTQHMICLYDNGRFFQISIPLAFPQNIARAIGNLGVTQK